MNRTQEFLQRLALEPAVLVTVEAAQGSVPREAGTWMAVFAEGQIGTIGGGNLEWQALAQARLALPGGDGAAGGTHAAPQPPQQLQPLKTQLRLALGPSLGQCCGGVVQLRLEAVSAVDGQRLAQSLAPRLAPLALFGGGHVGQALVKLLATLPLAITWIDSRDEIFPPDLASLAQCEHSDPVQAAVADLAAGSRVLIMSFSHAEDLDVVAACLTRLRLRDDLPYIGLIGSKTKWASFQHRLQERGFSSAECARITCPIGVPGISGKEPEVIAVAVAAQLLQNLG